MGLRLRLILAFLLVALAPLALLAWSVRPILDRSREALVDQRAEELAPRLSDAGLRARLEQRAFEVRDEVQRAFLSGEVALDDLRSERSGYFARKRRESARRKLGELLLPHDLDRVLLVDNSRLLFAFPEGAPQEIPPRLDSARSGWRWEPTRGVLVLSTAIPPDNTPVADRWTLLLVVENHFSPERLAVEHTAACGVPILVTPRLPGEPTQATTGSGDALALLRSRGGASVATLRADLSGIGTHQRTQVSTRLLFALAVGAGLALILAGLFANILARPLRRLSRAVEAIADHPGDADMMPGGGGEVGRLASAVDRMLAALRREQKRRTRAERAAAWQEVARRVAHEVRNPLTPIRLGVDNLRRAKRKGPELLTACLDEEAESILTEVERLERLVREFSQFARLPRPKPKPIDLVELVRKAALGQVGAHEEIVLSLETGEAPAMLRADPDLLSMAVANLARNAAQAMGPGGGKLHIVVASVHESGDELVEIRFEDSGPGIPEELLDQLFEPYVTGRGEGGTGLGLAIVQQVITEHGGRVSAENLPQGGACFRVLLPRRSDRCHES